MARLSRRGMNNVVIFTMLIMIALFNLDAFLPKSKLPSSRTLLPQDSFVLKIESGPNRLERAGQQWRQVSEGPPPPISPEQQIEAWVTAMLVPTENADLPSSTLSPVLAVVWLAGQTEGLVFAFYPGSEQTLVKFENQWFYLAEASLDQLLPWQAP